jgi:hypothetical protein
LSRIVLAQQNPVLVWAVQLPCAVVIRIKQQGVFGVEDIIDSGPSWGVGEGLQESSLKIIIISWG